MMTRKKILKISLIVIGISILIGGSIGYYMFNMPHRDVQNAQTDYALKSSEIVNEYLANVDLANEKYLDSEGESKIIEVTGNIYEIAVDFNSNKVLLLKSLADKAGVSCTFTAVTNAKVLNFKKGDEVVVKGVIRSGSSFDSDLDMYENVIMEKCDIVSNK